MILNDRCSPENEFDPEKSVRGFGRKK